MFYGEHLSAEEVSVKCPCGRPAIVEVFDEHKISRGWYCRDHAHRVRSELRRQAREQVAQAIVVRRSP